MEADITSQAVGLGANTDFSLMSLFLRADIIVKSVMIILIVCSIYSWAVLNETKTIYDELVETKFHHPDDVEGGAMYDLMHEATEPEEFCDGNVLGEKYGLNNLTGHVAAAAWLRLRAVSQLRLHGQYEGTEMGKRARAALNEYRWAIDLGLLGYDLFSLLDPKEYNLQ